MTWLYYPTLTDCFNFPARVVFLVNNVWSTDVPRWKLCVTSALLCSTFSSSTSNCSCRRKTHSSSVRLSQERKQHKEEDYTENQHFLLSCAVTNIVLKSYVYIKTRETDFSIIPEKQHDDILEPCG